MRARRMAAAAFIGLLGTGCSDGTGPGPQDLTEIVLDFCAGEAPAFFAFQNAGGTWTRVTPAGDGSVTFKVTEKFGIAMEFQSLGAYVTDIYFATTSDLGPIAGQQCTETFGSKTVNGTVANVTGNSEAIVSLSGDATLVLAGQTSFQLTNIAAGPQDLLAQREVFAGQSLIPDRLIVRRAVNIVDNGTMSVLDFGSNEPVTPASNTLTIAGLLAGETNFLDILFATASGTAHSLYSPPSFTSSPQTIFGVPSALTQSGDYHRLTLEADAANFGSYRGLNRFYRTPSDLTLALGGTLNAPQYSALGSSPYIRYRMQLASQVDYDSFVTASYGQGGAGSSRTVYVTTTKGYTDGTPATWSVDIPDLSAAGGYPSSAGLQSGLSTTRIAEAYSGALADYISARPADGATVRFAGSISSTSSIEMARTGPAQRARPGQRRPFGVRR